MPVTKDKNKASDTYHSIIEYCVHKILIRAKIPLFVAVTGESGTGKSYFTKALEKEMKTKGIPYSLINHDDFLIPRQEREALKKIVYESGKFKGKSYWEILENWYYLDAFQTLLNKLREQKPATYHPYDHVSGKILAEARIIEPARIILLENKLFLNQMDFIIELAVDRRNIVKRKIDRDSDVRTAEQTIEMHEKAQGYFWDRCKPLHPDIVIDNNDFALPKLIKA